MTDQNQPDMSGHKPCLLCDCWNATHHSRFTTTPVQPAEAELLMIRGFMVGVVNDVGVELCERHKTVIQVLNEIASPALETGQNPTKSVLVAPEPVRAAAPPPVGGIAIVSDLQKLAPVASSPGQVTIGPKTASAVAEFQSRPLTLDEILPSKIPIPTQQPVFGEPITVPCPSCNAQIGTKCQVGDKFGFHQSRIDAANPEQGIHSEFVASEE